MGSPYVGRDMRILITGGNGKLGRALAAALARHRLIALVIGVALLPLSLAACGDGDDDGALTPSPSEPVSFSEEQIQKWADELAESAQVSTRCPEGPNEKPAGAVAFDWNQSNVPREARAAVVQRLTEMLGPDLRPDCPAETP